jgi:hypothetical protein
VDFAQNVAHHIRQMRYFVQIVEINLQTKFYLNLQAQSKQAQHLTILMAQIILPL